MDGPVYLSMLLGNKIKNSQLIPLTWRVLREKPLKPKPPFWKSFCNPSNIPLVTITPTADETDFNIFLLNLFFGKIGLILWYKKNHGKKLVWPIISRVAKLWADTLKSGKYLKMIILLPMHLAIWNYIKPGQKVRSSFLKRQAAFILLKEWINQYRKKNTIMPICRA